MLYSQTKFHSWFDIMGKKLKYAMSLTIGQIDFRLDQNFLLLVFSFFINSQERGGFCARIVLDM